MTLSVIVPTLGRETLGTMLDSITRQGLVAGDEILILGDGPQPRACELAQSFGEPFRYIECPADHCYGNPQRNLGMKFASGDYLVFADDDNLIVPGSFALIRQAAAQYPGRPLLFRCRFLSGHIAPRKHKLRLGDFDTACGIWPNVPNRLAVWGRAYAGDYFFARDTLALYPNGEQDAVWFQEVIALHRPHMIAAAELENLVR